MKEIEEELSQGLKLLAKSSLVVLFGIILSKVFTYIYRIIIARSFGPEIYGVFSLAVMIVGWFVVFSSLGFSEGIVRYISWYRGKNEQNKIKYLFKLSLIFLFFSSILLAIILFFSAELISIKLFHNAELIVFLKVFSFLIPIFVFSDVLLATLRAFEKITSYIFILKIFQNSVKLILLIFFIFLGLKLESIIFSYFLAIFATLVIAYIVCRYSLPEIFKKTFIEKTTKKKIRKEYFSYSLPLMFSAVITSLLFWIDSFMIGYFLGVSDVGIYNAAIPIVLLLTLAPDIFMALFFPMITRQFSKNNISVVKELTLQVGKWIFILNFPVFIILFFFPDAITNLLFGAQYIAAGKAVKILSISYFFSALIGYTLKNLLAMKGKSKLILIDLVIIVILNIILNIFLIQKYGIVGAATATTISKVILTFIFLYQVYLLLKLFPLQGKIIRIILVSIIPTAILIFLTKIIPITLASLILLGIFFFLLYILLIFVTGCLEKNDILILKAIKKKLSTSS